METSNTKYFFVRAMRQEEEHFDVFFGNEVVAIGWSDFNFSEFDDPEVLVSQIRELPYNAELDPRSVGRTMNQIRYFKQLSEGDKIIVPYHSSIRLAVVDGEELYDRDQIHSTDLANQRKVKYIYGDDGGLLTIPRKDLSEGLARRLRMRGTFVGNLWEFDKEIESLFSNRSGWNEELQSEILRLESEFKSNLIAKICKGDTNLESGGVGLEKLVEELLILEGYEARIIPKNFFKHDEGDIDIQASKSDMFIEANLLVQVKHHEFESDEKAAKQLVKVRKLPEYENYQLAVVTTAKPSSKLIKVCETHDIVLIDGDRLADWLYQHLDKLDSSTRTKLGISSVPKLVRHFR